MASGGGGASTLALPSQADKRQVGIWAFKFLSGLATREIASIRLVNRWSRTVASPVGFGEACCRGLYAVGGVRAAYGRRGGGDPQPEAPVDRPALVQAHDDAGGEGVACARCAAYLLAWQPDGTVPPSPAVGGGRDAAGREVHHREHRHTALDHAERHRLKPRPVHWPVDHGYRRIDAGQRAGLEFVDHGSP